MTDLFGDISQLLQHNPWLAIVAVFFGGMTTALNPCVLAMTFTVLGLISGLLGRMFGDVGGFWKYLVAAVCLVMGLQLLGAFALDLRLPRMFNVRKEGRLGAFLLGLLFGVVSTPCAVPILAVLLAYVASEGNPVFGGLLLFVYALGHSGLVLIAGTSMGAAKGLLESKGLRKAHAVFQKAAGVLIIGVGLYFLFGR